MEVNELNEIANDIAVSRLELEEMERWLQEEMDKNPKIQQIQDKMAEKKNEKLRLQDSLLEKMKEAQLKSWKTEQANFARATRKSVSIDPVYKKQVEARLKDGEKVEGFELNETEYISIRLNK